MRRAVLLGLVALFAPLTAAAPQHPAAAAPVVEALLVGDSVMAGMAQPYGAQSRAQLAARHTYLLDAKGCRRLITTSCSIGDGSPPPNAINTIKAYAGRYNRALVVAVGYNDPTTGSAGLGAALDVILAEARRQGIPNVVWLTYRVAGSSASRSRAHNSLLYTRAAQDPILVLADWAGRSATMPSTWFSADGIHLGTNATIAMADLIGDTLDVIAQTRPIGCAVTNTTMAIPPPSSPPATVHSGNAATAAVPAKRLNIRCP